MSENYYSEFNEHGVVTPIKDLAAFPRSEQAVIGAKNLFNTSNAIGTISANITETRNADTSITLNGTTAAEYIFPKEEGSRGKGYYDLKEGESYKFSVGVVNNDIKLQVYYKATSGSSWAKLTEDVTAGQDLEFTIPNSYYDIWIRLDVLSGKTLNNVTVYPMIRLASDPDSTYAPFAMTNKQLTDAVNKNIIEMTGNAATFNVPLKRASDSNYTYGLIIIAGGAYHFWLKSSGESNAVVIQKIVDSNSSRTLTATYASGVLALTFNSTIYGGVMVETNNVVKS